MPVLRSLVSLVPVAGIALLTAAIHAEDADLAAINRIRTEAFQRSRVMDYLHLIADRNGPRLTGSPGYQAAAETAVGAFKEAGVAHAQLEPWGTFGRGWSWSRVAVQMTAPQQTTLAAFPADYSPGTGGTVAGEVVFAPLWEKGEQARTDDLVKYAERIEQWKSRYRGTLRGKVVMVDLPQPFTQPGNHAPRFDDQTLAKIDQTPYATPVMPRALPEAHLAAHHLPDGQGRALAGLGCDAARIRGQSLDAADAGERAHRSFSAHGRRRGAPADRLGHRCGRDHAERLRLLRRRRSAAAAVGGRDPRAVRTHPPARRARGAGAARDCRRRAVLSQGAGHQRDRGVAGQGARRRVRDARRAPRLLAWRHRRDRQRRRQRRGHGGDADPRARSTGRSRAACAQRCGVERNNACAAHVPTSSSTSPIR